MSNGEYHFLDLFFNPGSLAIVGVSRNPSSPNFHLVSNLVKLKFPGKIYPVNPNAEKLAGLKAYPDLKSIEGDIDLAIISVPANQVPDIVRDCIAKRVKAVSIITGGFSETGDNGKGLQGEILNLLRENGIRAIGPNALSPVNTANNFVISFSSVERMTCGTLSFIFQSGLYDPRTVATAINKIAPIPHHIQSCFLFIIQISLTDCFHRSILTIAQLLMVLLI